MSVQNDSDIISRKNQQTKHKSVTHHPRIKFIHVRLLIGRINVVGARLLIESGGAELYLHRDMACFEWIIAMIMKRSQHQLELRLTEKWEKLCENLIAQFFREIRHIFAKNKAENMRAYFLGSVAALNSFGSKWKLYFSKIYLKMTSSFKNFMKK